MDILNTFKKEKIIAVVRGANKDNCIQIYQILKEMDIHCIEITVEKPEALEAIETLSQIDDKLLIGAGTVLYKEQVDKIIEKGAKYMFAPVLDEKVVSYAIQKGLEVIPGVLSPSEVMKAYTLGAKAVKIFPISTVGSSYVKQFKAILPEMLYIGTGGLNEINSFEYVNNGLDAIGLGTCLINTNKLDDSKYIKDVKTKITTLKQKITTPL